EPFIRDGCAVYVERILRYADLQLIVVPEERIPGKGKREYIIHQEGLRIREKISSAGFMVVLDERGKFLSSETFALFLEKNSSKKISFILGGPYGLDDSLKKEADFRLALSPMTLVHSMARLFLLEQIYRAFTLLRGEPYHK
ncbi:MAG: 23S rRNA (pseudouridine(1915)-N(3))-methyltransferase RlmH, partial [Deltaproteobacteria bacterium]|nr:23S rRNA (pseudouridine(1915)-N(3))-methyltransferase RlmH [Deltaproteobacteria bacterium]